MGHQVTATMENKPFLVAAWKVRLILHAAAKAKKLLLALWERDPGFFFPGINYLIDNITDGSQVLSLSALLTHT